MKTTLTNMLKKLLLLSILTMVGAGVNQTVSAQEIDTSVVDEAWGLPNYVHGGGLNQEQVDETADLLGIENRGNVEEYAVTGEDLQTYLGYGSGSTSSMISSVLVQRESEGSGVNVLIETPGNITDITEEHYMNAAVTAGVEDATIQVASVQPVTGESALTGVYKAFDANGEDLDQERMDVAQEELETTSEISEGLDEEQTLELNQAMVEIKQQLAELSENKEGLIPTEEIRVTIINVIQEYNLDTVISETHITQLVNFFESYQQTDAIDSEQVREQLDQLSNDLQNRFGDLWQQAEDRGLIDRIGNFFRELWNTLVSLFN